MAQLLSRFGLARGHGTLGLQRRAQLLARSMQPGAYRAGLALLDAGDLLGGVALHVEQVHGRSQVGRQRTHHIPDVGAERVGRGDAGKLSLEALRAAIPRQAREVAAAVDGHADEPRFQMLVVVEGRLVLEQAYEHVLVHVVGIARRSRLRKRNAIHRVAPRIHGAAQKRLRTKRLRIISLKR